MAISLADALRQTGYSQDGALAVPASTEPTMTSILQKHIASLPQQLAANQAALDSAIGSWNKTDFGTGQPNPNYRPEAMQEFTQNYAPNVMGSIQKVTTPIAKALMSEFVPSVRAGEEMIVQHNTTPEKLLAAQKIGGMPVPSLGITKVGHTDPLADFGDITLIGNKGMATPSKANPVYAADAYTVRRPNIYTKTDFKADEFLTNKLSEPFGQFAKDQDVKGEISGILQNLDKNLENSTLSKIQFLQNEGKLADPSTFQTFKDYKMAARNAFDELPQSEHDKYYNWQPEYIGQLRQEAEQSGGKVIDQIFKGRSNTTGKELYKPATIENIVKEMAGKKPGDEGNFYTAGSLRGKLVPKLKNERDVLKARGKIISPEDFETFKEQINNKHSDINYDINKFLEENKAGNIDANSFLEDLAMGTTHKYEYSRELAKKVPQELKDRVASYASELKAAPTGYFEIKPQRAVGIGEFKGALVPKDLPSKARDVLERAGIKDIYTYANAEERKALTKKFGKEMFAGIPALPLAMPNDEAKAKTRQQILEEQFNKKRVE